METLLDKIQNATKRISDMVGEGKSLLAEMDDLRGKIDAAEAEDDKKPLRDKLDGKAADFDGLKDRIAEGKKDLARLQTLQETEDGIPEIPDAKPEGKSLTGDPARPKDHEAEAKAKTAGFVDYVMGGKSRMKPQICDMLTPKSESFKDGADGIVVPGRLRAAMMGKNWTRAFAAEGCPWDLDAMGKAIPMKSSDSDRSPLVPTENINVLLELPGEPAHIMDRATVVPTKTGTLYWPQLEQADATGEYGSVSGSWISEAAEKPETEAKFDQMSIATHEYAMYTELSSRLLNRSALGLEAILARLFRGSIMDAMDTAFISGSGSGQPLGILETSGLRKAYRDVANTVEYDDLVELEHTVRAYHRAGASWVMADGAMKSLKQEKTTTGQPLFVPSVAGGPVNTLLGYPYVTTHRLTLGNEGDTIFADLREYIIPVEEEIVIKRSDHYKFRNNVVAFVAYVVVGGRFVSPRAGVELDDGTAAS